MRRNLLATMALLSSVALVAGCGGGKKNKGGGSDGSGTTAASGGTSGSGGDSNTGGSGGSGGDSNASGSGGSGGSTGGTGGEGGDASGGTGGGGTGGGGTGGGGTGGGGTGGGGTGGGGTGGDGNGGTGGGPVSLCPDEIAGFSDAIAEVICQKRAECCEDNVDDCIAEVSEVLDDIYPDLDLAENRGTAELDCDAFDTCAAAIEAQSCDEWPAATGNDGGLPVDELACLAIIAPQVPEDGECLLTYECIDGYCDASETSCIEYVPLEGDCSSNICDPTVAFCNDNQVCQALLANGEDCTADAVCQSKLCDTDDSDTCIAPGPNECSYVPDPDTPAACSIGGPVGNAPLPPLVFGFVGVGLAWAARRRRPAR